jgi:hypothetical protein
MEHYPIREEETEGKVIITAPIIASIEGIIIIMTFTDPIVILQEEVAVGLISIMVHQEIDSPILRIRTHPLLLIYQELEIRRITLQRHQVLSTITIITPLLLREYHPYQLEVMLH